MVVAVEEMEEEAGKFGFPRRGRVGRAPFRKSLRTLSLVDASVHLLCERKSLGN